MYRLYWSKRTGVIAPQVLLEEIGAEYEIVVVDLEKEANFEPEFLAVNPMAQIPALELSDGTVVTESAAMVLHITDCHPEAQLAPLPGSVESAVFQRWLIFMAASLYTSDLRLFYPDQFTNDANGEDGVMASGRADMDRYFGILNDALDPGPYLLGQIFSAADIYLWMLAGWHPDREKLVEMNPRIKKLTDLVQARPAVARVWAEHN